MMSALFREKGAALRIDILREPEVESFIETHADILDSTFAHAEMSDEMRANLQRSDYIFSGFKTFHEVGEAFYSLLDEDGKKKPFNQFLNDVKKIDQTYNERYLRAEYNFASASADMAARWEQFSKDEDEYYLQYRTANDGAVRPEHAALHDVTLPASDSFWDSYYPPNGWNCRCTVVQVLRYMHEATPHNEAMQRGAKALSNDKKGMFNFNPGKQQKTFPDYNPYTISKCKGCTKANLKLFSGDPDNPQCQSCRIIKLLAKETHQNADEAIKKYSEEEWEHTYISQDNKGYLVTSKERIKEANENKRTIRVYTREKKMCYELADMGNRIEHLPLFKEGGSYDVNFNGVKSDLKQIDGGAGNIVKYAKHAFRKQGADAVIFKLMSHDSKYYDALGEARRKLSGPNRHFEG